MKRYARCRKKEERKKEERNNQRIAINVSCIKLTTCVQKVVFAHNVLKLLLFFLSDSGVEIIFLYYYCFCRSYTVTPFSAALNYVLFLTPLTLHFFCLLHVLAYLLFW